MGLHGVLGFLLIVAAGSAHVLLVSDDDTAKTITWPTEYSFRGETIDVISGEVETYEVWYSAEHNRSRIEYYGGITKKYYVAETDEDTGYEYVIYTVTDKDLDNVIQCEEKSHRGELKDFMPTFDEYEYSGETSYDGKQVQVWNKNTEDEGMKIEATLYVSKTDYNYDIPIRKSLKVYNLAKGAIETYRITTYNSFGHIITLDDVSISEEEECIFRGVLGENFKSDLRFLHPDELEDVDKAFHSYKRHHNKIYEKSEHEIRKAIFHKNWRYVESHNRKNLGYKLELNHFADYTDEEFSMLTGTRPSDPNAVGSIPFPHSDEELKGMENDLPEEFDMRLGGYLRPIRDQGNCGSCWAFSTTAAVEGTLSRANGGRNLDLSEQSLVDCAWGYENFGCSGGQLDKAFEYVLQNQIPTEREYGKYLELEGICHLENMTETFPIRGFSRVAIGNPVAMKAALNKYGPVTVAIYAGRNLKLYSSGVFYDYECDSEEGPNHGVVVVGYGEREGTPYWIVRNSWGESWGEDGYVLMSAVNNNCMVLDNAFYPVP
ncbi:unnamed protein product [Chilo suppressalis]|uniref:Uncharacterized protein n=1 Tax=Chilo suppressalis TaxID=168631 RepID=A0ABN8L8S1_CHISP|nr:unnamed protein product [Chilo suppressalis]